MLSVIVAAGCVGTAGTGAPTGTCTSDCGSAVPDAGEIREPVCGNGIIEGAETCDGTAGVCPTACDDGDPCTEDRLVGSADACDLACEATPIPNCLHDQARGVRIAGISIDQGVRIPLVENGIAIAPSDRLAPLVTERRALVRADWSLPQGPSFAARDIRAILTLHYPDGSSEALEAIQRTEYRDDPRYDNPSDGYVWRLEAAQMKQGTAYAVELFETDETYRQEPLPMPPPRFPEEPGATAELGIDGEPTTLHLVLVPIHHDLGPACEPAPDLTAMIDPGRATRVLAGGGFDRMPAIQFIQERMIAMNPVSKVEVVLHDPIRFTGNAVVAPEELLAELRQLREIDDAKPWQFYYGVTRPCDVDSKPNFGGVAPLPPAPFAPTVDRATLRVGWGRYFADGVEAHIVVHEVGHAQGRRHVDCGNPEDLEPDYPHRAGNIGGFGWDIFGNSIVTPDAADYMGYCYPRWVSAYGWNKLFPWIAEVSSWERQALFSAPRPMLYATVDPGRWDAWWTGTTSGAAPEEGPDVGFSVQFYRGTELLADTPAAHQAVPETERAFFLAVPLPSAWNEVTHIGWSDGSAQTVVSVDEVRQLH